MACSEYNRNRQLRGMLVSTHRPRYSCLSPTSGSIQHSPVRFTAAANSFQPIRKVELWIDGNKIKEQFRSWFDFTTSVTPGTHKVTIFANGYDDDFQRTSFLLTVN